MCYHRPGYPTQTLRMVYYDPIEVVVAFMDSYNPKDAFNELSNYAENGNIAASYELAKLYLLGGWDYRAIQDDMLMDTLTRNRNLLIHTKIHI